MEFRGYLTADNRLTAEEAFSEYEHWEEIADDVVKETCAVPFLACYSGYVHRYIWYRGFHREKYYLVAKRLPSESVRYLSQCNCYRCALSIYNPLRRFVSPYVVDCLLTGELASKKRIEESKAGKKNSYGPLTELFALLILLYLLW